MELIKAATLAEPLACLPACLAACESWWLARWWPLPRPPHRFVIPASALCVSEMENFLVFIVTWHAPNNQFVLAVSRLPAAAKDPVSLGVLPLPQRHVTVV